MKKTGLITALVTGIIFMLISSAGISCPRDMQPADIQEQELSDGRTNPEMYTKYNLAFTAPAAASNGAHRPGGQSWHPVPSNGGRAGAQIHGRLETVLKNGKVSGPETVENFQSAILQFISGRISENSHYISLHKIVI